MVFQHFNLFPHLTVLENITLGPRKLRKMPTAEANALAEKLLRQVGLSDKRDAYPSQLSGGQKQRIAIARTLAMEPDVIFSTSRLRRSILKWSVRCLKSRRILQRMA